MIVLFLNTSKGYKSLHHIIKNKLHHLVKAVITYNDSKTQDESYEKIKQLCELHNITIHDKSEKVDYNQYYKLAIGWQFLIKDEKNLFVIHDSLLPKYRGFAPTVNALINGESKIGATLIRSSSEYDKGEIFKQIEIEVTYPIKISESISKLESIYQDLVMSFLCVLQNNQVVETFPQNESKASYSLWRNDDDYFINWNWDANKIKRFVDALGFPYDGAKTILNGQILKVSEVKVIEDVEIENRQCGKQIFILKDCPVIVCGTGLIKIEQAFDKTHKVYKFKQFRNYFKNI